MIDGRFYLNSKIKRLKYQPNGFETTQPFDGQSFYVHPQHAYQFSNDYWHQ